jgi:hypothetical protein
VVAQQAGSEGYSNRRRGQAANDFSEGKASPGLLLATQSPGDFDYKCRDTVRSWLVGRVKEQTALNKFKPLFAESKVDVAANLPSQETGQFHLLREQEVCALTTWRSLVSTEQLPEEHILEMARASQKNETHV